MICEHQSTINENMPLRFLPYITRLLENSLLDGNLVYGRKRILLPTPEFMVLYNGEVEYPDGEMRLSDAYRLRQDKVWLELVVDIYNINEGHNRDRVEKSEFLRGYVAFVATARQLWREEQAARPDLNSETIINRAVSQAISWRRQHGILTEFWERLSSEEKLMLTDEWNMETALAYRFKEGKEEGWLEGKEEGRLDGKAEERKAIARNLLQAGVAIETISASTGLSLDEIQSLVQ